MHRVSKVNLGRAALVAPVLACVGLVGVGVASSFTLGVAKNATVTNQSGAVKHESIVVSSRSFAVYYLTGDSQRHPECTAANQCFRFWPPVTVSSPKRLNKARGVSGKLGVWHRDGFFQVTLAGRPVYRFAPDTKRDAATGEGIQSFGGTWHVIRPASAGGGAKASSPGPAPSGMSPSACAYPPCP